jgi:hypothetical protein
MGKPLGLGSVKLSIESCQKVDRAQRYTVAGLSAERYQPLQGWEQIRDDYKAKMMRPDIKNALCLLGRIPADGTIPIHTPTIEPAPGQSLDLETKTFQWFVANDEAKGPQKALPPLTDQDTELPTLERCRSTEHSADRSRAAGN